MKKTLMKRIIAFILVITLLPWDSYIGCFSNVQAAEISNTVTGGDSNTSYTVTDGDSILDDTVTGGDSIIIEDFIVAPEDLGNTGFRLEDDMMVSGDYCLKEGTLDLDGYTLTIQGDFIQAGGIVDVNDGQLFIEGDYRMQTRNGEADSYSYESSAGSLHMTSAGDYVLVKGSYVSDSTADSTGYLSEGTLEVKGDFTINSTYSTKNFFATGNHTLLLSGNTLQKVNVNASNASQSHAANVEITNKSEDGVTFVQSLYVAGNIGDHENVVNGSISIGSSTTFTDNYFGGNVLIGHSTALSKVMTIGGNLTIANYVDLSGIIRVKGNCTQNSYGDLYMNKGRLEIEGDYVVNNSYKSCVRMQHAEDYICVYGNVTYNPYSYSESYLSAGVFEIRGNLSSGRGIVASRTHKFLFSGDKRQEIAIATNEYFATIELQNNSEEGIYSKTTFKKQALIRNGCKLTYGDLVGTYGWTLEEDTVYEGDLLLLEDTLDLNGYTLTVSGDMVQASGTVYVNGGRLIVEGDYRMQSRTETNGEYTYGTSSGILQMTNDTDYVQVKGNYISDSYSNTTNLMTAGILDIKGDITISDAYSKYSFVATENHTLLLSGNGLQTINVNDSRYDYARIANLEITNESEEGILFHKVLHVTGIVTDNNNIVNGYVGIANSTTLTNNSFTGSIYIGQGVTMDDTWTINGNLNISSSTTISGNILVKGDCVQYSYLYMSNGRLEIEGNYTITGNSELNMRNTRDYICVHGNVVHNPGYFGSLSAGTFEIKGNLTSGRCLYASGSNKFIFSGTGKQVISISENEYFATIELQNTSEEGIYSATAFKKTTLIRNGCKMTYGDMVGEYGWTLEQDTVYEGDLILIEDTLDLNGHSLTVTGDLIQLSGIVSINGGQLIVEGDYRMQSRSGEEDAYTYGSSTGLLKMTNAEDYVLIMGSYLSDSASNSTGYLTAGIMEVKGDMVVNRTYSSYSFIAAENHTLKLSGDGLQSINIADSRDSYSRAANLEITNESEEGVVLEQTLYAGGLVSAHGNVVKGTLGVFGTASFADNYYGGNVTVSSSFNFKEELTIGGNLSLSSYITISGNVLVKGNCSQYGYLTMSNGRLEIEGDYYISDWSTRLYMQHANDYILVHGNATISPSSSTLKAGTIELKGNLTSTGGLYAYENHKFIFSGAQKQTISISDREYFATLELLNTSEEGVYSAKPFTKQTLICNDSKLTYGDGVGVWGWTLEEDTVYEGDLILLEGTLNLNGYSLTVTGDLIQWSGMVDVNGGKLIVEGDYRMQFRSGEEDAYTYGASSGLLKMTTDEDYVLVKGDFLSDVTKSHSGYLTNGILELQGSMTINNSYNSYGFAATENHTLLLSGNQAQNISIASSNPSYSRIANMEVTNSGEDGVSFVQNIYVTGNINGHGNLIKGNLGLFTTTTFTDNYYRGNIYIGQYVDILGEVTFDGNVQAATSLAISGNIHVKGNFTQYSYLTMNNGKLEVDGDYNITARWTRLYMKHEADYIHVHGNVNYSPDYNEVLTAGTFEIGGNLTSARGLYANGTHKFLFSGDDKQVISLADGEYFATVELQNYSAEGVFSTTTFTKQTLIRNGCKLTYGDREGEYGWTLWEDQVYEGDLLLMDDTLDLNGHTLTITGDFVQMSGILKVNGGSLIVKGDYRMQSRSGEPGAYTYAGSSGQLVMQNEADRVTVGGDFIMNTTVATDGKCTAGTLELQGDFGQPGGKAYIATGSHTIIFSGRKSQTWSQTAAPTIVHLINRNSKKLLINASPTVTGTVTDEKGTISGSGTLIISTIEQIKNSTYSGSVTFTRENTLTEDLKVGALILAQNSSLHAGDFSIEAGAVILNGNLYLQNAQLVCTNDFTVNQYGRLYMQEAFGSILTGGDFKFASQYNHNGWLTKGSIEIRGHFMQSGYVNFIATENHSVILSKKLTTTGKHLVQNITFNCGAGTTRFNKLILKKSIEGYYFNNPIETISNEVVYEIEDETAPTGVTYLNVADTTETTVTLTYGGAEDASGILGYEIYRDGVKVAATGETIYTDRGLSPDKEYTYMVYPFDSYRNLAETSPETIAVTKKDTEAPDIPGGLAVLTRTGSSITLNWNVSSDNVGDVRYIVYRNGEMVGSQLKDTSYKDSGLVPNTVYKYQVVAYDAAGNASAKSKAVEAVAAMPEITEVSPADYCGIGGEKVTLTVKFKNVGNATGNRVKIEYQNQDGEWEMLSPAMLGQKHYNNSTFYVSYTWNISKLNGEYKVRYTLYDAEQNTDVKDVVYFIDREAPKLPAEFDADTENGIVNLFWDASESADCSYYKLYRKEADEETYTLLAKLSDRYHTGYSDKEVEEGKTYVYALVAGDGYGNESDYSVPAVIEVDEDLAAPEIKNIMPKAGRINKSAKLTITAADNRSVAAVRLEYKTEAATEWNHLAEVETIDNIADYLWDTTALEDGVYMIRAVAIDRNGNESTEEFTRRYDVDNTGIAQIELTEHTITATGVRIHWADVVENDFAYFQIEEVCGEEVVKVGTVSNILGYDVTGLVPGNEYTFQVIGYDNLGNRGIPSEPLTITTTEDSTAPIIEAVYPIASYYKDTLELQVRAKDNYAIQKAVFSYSTDGTSFEQIAEVAADTVSGSCTLKKDFDISSFPEGTLFIQFEVYDVAGNKNALLSTGEDVIVEYIIDRTAPAKVNGVAASGVSGYVELNWNTDAEKDVKSYKIYRADAETGLFTVISEECTTKNYYDTAVEAGNTYIYKVSATDIAGNIGECSEELYVTVAEDKEAPVITGISPADGETVGAGVEIKAFAMDNVKLSNVTLEYLAVNSEQEIWSTLSTNSTGERSCLAEVVWETDELEEGDYYIRAIATDDAGNVSEIYQVTYTLDLTAPAEPVLTAQNGHYEILLKVNEAEEEDFAYYEYYRRIVGEEEYSIIKKDTEPQYTDAQVIPNTVYSYKVAAYDKCGNVSWSPEQTAYADEIDVVAPIALLPENLVGMVDMELAFDGLGSSDNVRITSYEWNMGNGDVITGAQPVYTYPEAGSYVVTLKVSDAAGNTASASTTVHIYEKDGRGTSTVKIVDEAGAAIPFALVYVELSDGGTLSMKADSKGCVSIVATTGAHKVAAYSTGYLPDDIDILISEYETREHVLTLVKDELIVGELNVRRMTLGEMIEAGVDFSAPENMHKYVFNLSLTFKECPIPVHIEYITGSGWHKAGTGGSGNGTQVENGTSSGSGYREKQSLEICSIDTEAEVPILVYVNTTQSISWLKEMFYVELGILNAADSEYVITDSEARLYLPQGVSLAKTSSGQGMTQSMGDIRGQEVKSVSWVVKGDESGSYRVSASFEGTLMPFNTKVSAHFVSKDEIQVSTPGEGIHIYVMPEKTAYHGKDYYIQFAVANEGTQCYYSLQTSFGPYRVPDYEYSVTDIWSGETHTETYSNINVSDPSHVSQAMLVRDGQVLTFSVFAPGDVYYGTYVTPFSGTGTADVYYELIDYVVETLKGANTGVQVSVSPIGGHINRSYWGCIDMSASYADPVDLTTGYFYDETTAFLVNGGAALSLETHYSSGATQAEGELGYGWYHDYEMWVEQKGGVLYFHSTPYATYSFISQDAMNGYLYGTISGDNLVLAEGAKYSYGNYVSLSQSMKDVSLKRNTDGTYTMTWKNGTTYEFNSSGKLVKLTDIEGMSVSVNYMGSQTILQENISGRKMYLNHDEEGRLVSVSDDNDRITAFSYDEQGRMVSLTSPIGEVICYTYDEQNRILTEANSQGIYVTNEYDEKGRVTRQTDALGGIQTFSYEEAADGGLTVCITDANGISKQAVMDSDGRMVKMVNENGGTTQYSYDSEGNLLCDKDSYGNCILSEYDEAGNLVKVTDTGNLSTSMTYDSHGNVTSITNASGQTAHYTYDSHNRKSASTDYSGLMTTYEYDDSGLLIKQTTEGLGSVYYTYEKGLLSSVTDYCGNTTYSYYDEAGNLIKSVDAMGNATAYAYDKAGRMLSSTDALGNTTTYTYDCNNNVTSITDALGNVTRNTYDAAGRQTRVTYPDGTFMEYEYDAMGHTTGVVFADGTKNTYVCDASGNVVKEILADGTELTYAYDLLNQRISETDAEGRTVTYEYYPNGNPYKVTYPDGTYELYTYNTQWKTAAYTNTAGYTTSYEYDAMGNLTLQRDALGNTSRYTYDRFGNVVKETDPNGNVTTYGYDSNGNCIRMTDALGTSVYMEYDALNRMTGAYMLNVEDEEYRVSYTYDALGRVDSVTDELGNTSTYSYDSQGNVISVTDAKGTVLSVSSYDAMGRVTETTDALGLTTTYSYDRMGNLLQAVELLNEQAARVTGYQYDAMGRLTQVTDPLEGITGTCYDEHGNISSITDANGGTTSYTYDSVGRLLTEVTPVGSCYSYTYNAQGLLAELENARGQKTSYTYDAIGRVTSMTDELGTVTYTYDNNSNVLTVTDEQGTISRKYDALNRVTEYTDYKGNTVKYAYDELGNLISLTYPGGEIVRYTYYKNGLLQSVTDGEGNVTGYEYDVNGNLTHTTRPNGTEEICTYNAAGLLVEQKDVKGEEILTQYTYTYDGYGNITTIEGTETADTKEGIGRLTSASMTYDADNRLLTYNGEELQYDADGNMTYGPVGGGMGELVYDCRNRLVSAGGVTYTYDAENIRMSAETADYLEVYVTDTVSASLSRVLTMTVYEKQNGVTQAEGTTTTYLYGQGLICEEREGNYLNHHYNNLGSTMKLTDAAGEVKAGFTYGTYGELLSGDSSLTHFLYNGRCGVSTDANGLYYMRQRYYNPEIKRFINQDILTGSTDNSQSLNQYSYVQGNPVSYTDPFGLSPANGLYTGTGVTHTVLGLLGMVPGLIGATANFMDGLVYAFVDRDLGMAALCFTDAVTFGVTKHATNLIQANKYVTTAKALLKATRVVSNSLSFGVLANNVMKTGTLMYEKYYIQGQSVDSNTKWEVANIVFSTVGCVLSGRGMAKGVNELGDMLRTKGFVNGLKDDMLQFANSVKSKIRKLDNGGYLNLGAFSGKTSSTVSVNPGFDNWLNKGASDYKVYFGVKNGKHVYVGITKQAPEARLAQHNSINNKNPKGFSRLDVQYNGLTRNQARALEQYFINKPNGPNKMNVINSISEDHRYSKEAMTWAKQYLGIEE